MMRRDIETDPQVHLIIAQSTSQTMLIVGNSFTSLRAKSQWEIRGNALCLCLFPTRPSR